MIKTQHLATERLGTKGARMNVDQKSCGFEIWEDDEKPSLAGLSAETFETLYQDFCVLLVRIKDQRPVAGIREGFREDIIREYREYRELNGELDLKLSEYVTKPGPSRLAQNYQTRDDLRKGLSSKLER